MDHAFEIIFALDEVITYGGMNEPIPLQQVRVNLVGARNGCEGRRWRVTRRSYWRWFRRAR